MSTTKVGTVEISNKIQESVEIIDQVSEYSHLITDSLFLFIGGMISVYILHKLVSKLLYPFISEKGLLPRLIKVIFSTFYVLILAISLLLVMSGLGFEVKIIAKIVILVILACAVLVFFLVPFIPKLPFVFGNLVEINGVLGTVSCISTFHTTLKKFDGTLVYLPNAIVMATKILNYHQVAERRIEMNITISTHSNIQESIDIFIKLMTEDKRVIDKPAPPSVYATEADSSGIKLVGYCWTKNDDWLSTQSDLWIKLVEVFIRTEGIAMARPQNEVYLIKQE